MSELVKSRYLWFRVSIIVGLLLGLLLLVDTVIAYHYVARGLVAEEAQREAERWTMSIVHIARLTGIHDSSRFAPVLNELIHGAPKQIAWIRIVTMDGRIAVETTRADGAPTYSPEKLRSILEEREIRPREQVTPSGRVLITLNPLPLHLLADGLPQPDLNPQSGPKLVEMALYVDRISVHFGPLRQHLIIGISAAFALLVAVISIGLRFGNYLRGKQVEKELALARSVQFGLFPNEGSIATQIQFAAQCIPAWQVGGDLYDVFQTDNGEIALILGDVSGKGLPAALLMGVVQGIVRASGTMASALHHNLAAERLNQFLCRKTARERFVTLFWCYFNAQQGVLRYINAGHLPPLLVRRGARITEVLRLDRAGPVLGVLPGAHYEQTEIAVEPGDLLVVCSDGILEASDSQQQEFGEKRLIASAERNWAKSPADICDAILADVQSFLGQELPQDDQTLLVARLEPKRMEAVAAAEGTRAVQVRTV